MIAIASLIDKVDKSKLERLNCASLESLCIAIGHPDLYCSVIDRVPDLKYIFLHKRLCTDTYVGIRAYYYEDELVACSNQIGRKYDEVFEWVSKEKFILVKNYLLSKQIENGPDNILDLNEDVTSIVEYE